ncbi:MAG: SulP family inorganic anion transporter [Limisphaerales bacterium]
MTEEPRPRFSFRPRLFVALRGYNRSDFTSDLTAGLTVGIVALPLAMAFAIASGVDPKAGLWTAIIAGFLISALGGSRVQIGGPTGAFVGIVYATIAQYGIQNLVICTAMAGVMLVIMSAARLGTMIKFIPYPVTTGFTSGIAIIIFSTQIKDFFGLKVDKVPAEFPEKMKVLLEHASSVNWTNVALAAVSLAVIIFWPRRLARRVPGSIVALLLGTMAVSIFGLHVETIGTRFGGIPNAIPIPHLPWVNWQTIRDLLVPSFTIAFLAGIESLLSAVVADGMIDDRHDSNQELMAQGIANIACAIFGGIPATGAIARTATNIRSGARTPIAGMIHALVLLLIVLVGAPLAKNIPLATLSAVLIFVAYNMGEWHQFKRLTKWPKSDALVFLTAFTLTVLVDLTVAVAVGMVLASMLLIKRISETTQILREDEFPEPDSEKLPMKDVPPEVQVFRLFGAFTFGAADKLETCLKRARQQPDVLILRMRQVLAMDSTGLNALEDLYEKLTQKGRYLILSGPHSQPLFMMQRADFVDRIGIENVCATFEESLDRARQLLEEKRNPKPPAPTPAEAPSEATHR